MTPVQDYIILRDVASPQKPHHIVVFDYFFMRFYGVFVFLIKMTLS